MECQRSFPYVPLLLCVLSSILLLLVSLNSEFLLIFLRRRSFLQDNVEKASSDSLDTVMYEQLKLFKRPLTSVKTNYEFQPTEFGKIQSSQLFDVDVKPPEESGGKRSSLSGEWMEKSRKPLGRDLKEEEFDHSTKMPVSR
jgi:hypothetical protein